MHSSVRVNNVLRDTTRDTLKVRGEERASCLRGGGDAPASKLSVPSRPSAYGRPSERSERPPSAPASKLSVPWRPSADRSESALTTRASRPQRQSSRCPGARARIATPERGAKRRSERGERLLSAPASKFSVPKRPSAERSESALAARAWRPPALKLSVPWRPSAERAPERGSLHQPARLDCATSLHDQNHPSCVGELLWFWLPGFWPRWEGGRGWEPSLRGEAHPSPPLFSPNTWRVVARLHCHLTLATNSRIESIIFLLLKNLNPNT